MAELRIKGAFVGPGEQKTAERLRDNLPADWDIFASRKLPGETRDDVDLIVVGQSAIFVLEEKAWGPRIVCDDNYWYVNDSARPNPLNRNAQLARKVAGLLREHATGYRNVKGKRVIPAVILSHDDARVFAGRNHHSDENIWLLATAADKLQELDAAHTPLGPVRKAVVTYLDDRPAASGQLKIGDYSIKGRIEVPGLEQAYFAQSPDDQEVILKCYRVRQLRELGDPRTFLERETRALNKLAEAGRTWRSLPYFEDPAHELFVVPVIPPDNARTLEAAVRKPGPERDGGTLDAHVARSVVADAFAALAEVHEHGMVHRALHPRRVWLGRRMRALFSDFHLAKMRGDVTISPWATDCDISEDYRAPECRQQVGLATEKSDVYSLAKCLAYWLLGTPLAGQTDDQIDAALREKFPWAEGLTRALAADPEDRPEAEAMAASFSERGDAAPPGPDEMDTFEVGSLVGGRYEIKTQLGRGGFATSWQVYDRQRAGTMVLKEFRHGVPDELRAEYRAGDLLRHDRCGAVYDLHLDTEPHYLVSEFVEGQSLAAAGVQRDIDELRVIAADVLEALAYIHSKDLVHGDVTPPNIIVANDGSGHAKLIDFGLAVPTGQRHGGWNPRFAAPEVVRGDTASSLSDLFGFAASVVYAMLGRHAFTMAHGSFQTQPPTEDEKRIWGSEGSALLDVLFKAIDATPSQRPTTAEAFHALINSTRPATPSPPEPRRRHRPEDREVPLVRQVNPNVEAIRRLYRASGRGNAGNRGLDDPFAVDTYVTTLLDDRLLPQVIAGELDLVLLSGNPGDGKTSLLFQLGQELTRRGATVVSSDPAGWQIRLDGRLFIAVFDASEAHGDLSSDAMLHQALEPVLRQSEPSTALIAINDGRLLQFFTDYEDQYEDWKFAIDDQLSGADTPGSRVALVDLKRRTLASGPDEAGLADRALARLTDPEFWSICETCEAKFDCPILANRDVLTGPGAAAFNELITISHLRRRRRATFRDVRSAAAWLITGDRGCEDIHELREAGRNPRLVPGALAHDLAFATDSNDYLVDEWSNLDPAEVAAPALDRFRRSQVGEQSALQYASNRSIARAIYFRELAAGSVRAEDVSAYRYLDEFRHMLTGGARPAVAKRLLLGISRLVGAHGYTSSGLAVSSGMAHSAWAILHVIPPEEFELLMPTSAQPYIETMADTLTLRHRSGPFLELTLDTAEIVLRAADGELVNDFASDAIQQEIDSFVQKLARQPSMAARIVDSAGTEAIVSVRDRTIVLEQS
ncbi:protein kinase [Actinotalea sp. AC32]|nr:protein kinase [Actinotalea sp. AC32]